MMSPPSSLLHSLHSFGLPPTDATKLADYAAATAMPIDGALSRLSQLRFGIDSNIVTADEAAVLLRSQPELLRREFGVALETDSLVCAAKPCDTLLSPDKDGKPRWPGEVNLRDWLSREHPLTTTEDGSGEVRLCHNLDFATSGVIVAAKSKEAANDVSLCFRDRVARKLYCALVFDHPPWQATLWDARIQPSTRKFKQRISGGGKKAETWVSVAARGKLTVGENAGRDASLLWLEPKTGRRHQLRLHCSHGGHAIVGDLTYAKDRLMYRMFLHAASLELPLEGGDVRCEAPLSPSHLAPAGWTDVFEAEEELRSPEGWEGAAGRLIIK